MTPKEAGALRKLAKEPLGAPIGEVKAALDDFEWFESVGMRGCLDIVDLGLAPGPVLIDSVKEDRDKAVELARLLPDARHAAKAMRRIGGLLERACNRFEAALPIRPDAGEILAEAKESNA